MEAAGTSCHNSICSLCLLLLTRLLIVRGRSSLLTGAALLLGTRESPRLRELLRASIPIPLGE